MTLKKLKVDVNCDIDDKQIKILKKKVLKIKKLIDDINKKEINIEFNVTEREKVKKWWMFW